MVSYNIQPELLQDKYNYIETEIVILLVGYGTTKTVNNWGKQHALYRVVEQQVL